MNRYFMFSADSDVGVQEVCGIIVAVGEAMSGKAPEAIGLKQASSKPHVSVCFTYLSRGRVRGNSHSYQTAKVKYFPVYFPFIGPMTRLRQSVIPVFSTAEQ
jgi:hypothetical protein